VILLADLVAAEQRSALPPALAQLDLGPAPLPGSRRVLDGDYIRGRVRQAGFDPRGVRLAHGAPIPVTRSSQKVTRREMSGWVRVYLSGRLANAPGEVEIAEITVDQDLILPAGELRHKIIPPPNQALAGKVPLAIHCYVEGREVKRVWAMAKIVVRAEVVLARKPLRRYQLIAPDDIKLVAMDLAQLPSGVLTDSQEAVGRRTQRKIDPNTVLRADLVELPPLIKRRDVVVIVAEAPGLSITALGEAQESGRLNERIRVTNLDSRKRIFARVVDATTVRVDF
jgi:flagella basal body P-ring formation protein FlgA